MNSSRGHNSVLAIHTGSPTERYTWTALSKKAPTGLNRCHTKRRILIFFSDFSGFAKFYNHAFSSFRAI